MIYSRAAIGGTLTPKSSFFLCKQLLCVLIIAMAHKIIKNSLRFNLRCKISQDINRIRKQHTQLTKLNLKFLWASFIIQNSCTYIELSSYIIYSITLIQPICMKSSTSKQWFCGGQTNYLLFYQHACTQTFCLHLCYGMYSILRSCYIVEYISTLLGSLGS